MPRSPTNARASIFWPHCASGSPSGFIIGWNPTSFLCSVATIASGVPLLELERLLAAVARDPDLHSLMLYCGGPPTILGVWQHPADEGQRAPAERTQTAELWLSMVAEAAEGQRVGTDSFLPSLREVFCCGCRYRAALQVLALPSALCAARSTARAVCRLAAHSVQARLQRCQR